MPFLSRDQRNSPFSLQGTEAGRTGTAQDIWGNGPRLIPALISVPVTITVCHVAMQEKEAGQALRDLTFVYHAAHLDRRPAGNSEVVSGRKLYLAGGIRRVGTAEDWRCECAYIILEIRMVEGIEGVNRDLQLGDAASRVFRAKSQ